MNNTNNKVYIIAEAGINHNGELKTALEMVKYAKNMGADCIKFQAFEIDKLLSKEANSAEYQKKETGKSKQKDVLKDLQLTRNELKDLFIECKKLRIDFLCTAFDEDLLKYLVSLGMTKIKIPSGEITNFPFLKCAAKLSVPIILSTGMSSMIEVESAVNFMKNFNKKLDLIILHCTSLYPAPINTLNLLAIKSLSQKFNTKIGYSDHSINNVASLGAIGLGARIIEKHFTLDKNFKGPDQKASLDISQFTLFINEIRNLEKALGFNEKLPHKLELKTSKVARRSWHARRNIKSNSKLNENDLILLRPGTEISGIKSIIGYRTNKFIKKGSIIKQKWLDDYEI
jgi:N,N'-diacetyllegionaminate synthase